MKWLEKLFGKKCPHRMKCASYNKDSKTCNIDGGDYFGRGEVSCFKGK